MIGLYRVGTAKKRESVKRHARVTLWDQFRNAGRIKSACDSRGVFAAKCIACIESRLIYITRQFTDRTESYI